MTYYKFLKSDGNATHAMGFKWNLPTAKRAGKWMPPIKGELVPCQNGYHVCREQDLLEWFHETLYEVEIRGDLKEEEGKVVVREARLLRRVETWNERSMRMFACDCADRAMDIYEKRYGKHQPSRDCIEVTRKFANGEATREQLDVARDAAKDAAWYVVRYETWYEAWYAAWYAAWNAAWYEASEREWQKNRLMQYLRGEL